MDFRRLAIFSDFGIFIHSTNGQTLKIRMGEWDASSNTEPIQAQEFQVSRIFIHPQFQASNLRNDVALLRLASPVQLGQVRNIFFWRRKFIKLVMISREVDYNHTTAIFQQNKSLKYFSNLLRLLFYHGCHYIVVVDFLWLFDFFTFELLAFT